jgi:hypothetical protein
MPDGTCRCPDALSTLHGNGPRDRGVVPPGKLADERCPAKERERRASGITSGNAAGRVALPSVVVAGVFPDLVSSSEPRQTIRFRFGSPWEGKARACLTGAQPDRPTRCGSSQSCVRRWLRSPAGRSSGPRRTIRFRFGSRQEGRAHARIRRPNSQRVQRPSSPPPERPLEPGCDVVGRSSASPELLILISSRQTRQMQSRFSWADINHADSTLGGAQFHRRFIGLYIPRKSPWKR